ncbi:MAG: hypothetical protein ACRD3W_21320 [Terriglobales bacterium]
MDAFDLLFKSNLVNWILLIVALVWGWNKLTPPMFEARRTRIESGLAEAKLAREEGEKFLSEQKQRLANAEEELSKKLAEARHFAEQQQQLIREQTEKELVDLERKIKAQIENERQMAITELRAAAARASIKLTQHLLPTLLTPEVKSTLLSQFMEQLDKTVSGPKLSAGQFESTRH